MVEFTAGTPEVRPRDSAATTAPESFGARSLGQIVRSALFFAFFSLYAPLGIGAPQRLVVFPLIKLLPERKGSILGAWFRFQAKATVWLARVLASVRVRVRGSLPQGPCIAVMNHQSVFDIPIAYSLLGSPLPLVPYRPRYGRGIPGISPLARASGSPIVQRSGGSTAEEIRGIETAAEKVQRGENSIIVFAEGHRTRTGEIGPFMRRGLSLILARAKRPVYCLVVDGLWHARTAVDTARSFAGSTVSVSVLGPFESPAVADINDFIDNTRQRMVAELRRMREEPW